jgi:hypothetical protein
MRGNANLTVFTNQTTTATSAAQDVSAAYAASLYVSIVQAGTATTAASFTVQVSPDGGGTFYNLTPAGFAAGLAPATYQWVIAIPADATHVKVAYTQQAGGTSSTLTAQIAEITVI